MCWFQWLRVLHVIRSKLEMNVGEKTEVRAPLASQETEEEEGSIQLCGVVSEFTRGKEFKVGCSWLDTQSLNKQESVY